MAVVRRIARLIWGDEVEHALRPVLAINLVAAMAGTTWWSYMGIWAVRRLGAEHELPVAYAVGAVLSACFGYFTGHLSDHVGRRRLILTGEGAMVVYPLVLLAIGSSKWPGVAALAFAGVLGSIGGSSSQAMVADLVPPSRHEHAYASVRVASNLGVACGPPLGALFYFVGGWSLLLASVSALSLVVWVMAFRFLPRGGDYAPEGPPARGSFGVIVRDTTFLVFLGSAVCAWIVYVAYEVALPISLVQSHGVTPALWGVLAVVNPLFVTLFQLRLTRAMAWLPAPTKLAVAMLLMGLPFLALIGTSAIGAIAGMIALFVIGEMLWVPTSQAIAARLAPVDLRGAYMGAIGAGPAVGFALAPLFGLSIRNGVGDDAMWIFFAALAVVAAVLGALGSRRAIRRPGRVLAGES